MWPIYLLYIICRQTMGLPQAWSSQDWVFRLEMSRDPVLEVLVLNTKVLVLVLEVGCLGLWLVLKPYGLIGLFSRVNALVNSICSIRGRFSGLHSLLNQKKCWSNAALTDDLSHGHCFGSMLCVRMTCCHSPQWWGYEKKPARYYGKCHSAWLYLNL